MSSTNLIYDDDEPPTRYFEIQQANVVWKYNAEDEGHNTMVGVRLTNMI